MNNFTKNALIIAGLVVLLLIVGYAFYSPERGAEVPNGQNNGQQANGQKGDENDNSITYRTVNLYYYNQEEAEELSDPCSREAVVPVERQLPITITPIQDTIRLLISGQLTESEKEAGFTTEFPNEGFALQGADLDEGVLTLEFSDMNNFTTGGSCRVNLLWSQIEKTALQFEEVDEVRFIPEELFQP